MDRDLHEVGGPSRERAPWRQLFLPSSDSAGSPEEEEGMSGPSHDKGKGRVLVSEEVQGEVTGVIYNSLRSGLPGPTSPGEVLCRKSEAYPVETDEGGGGPGGGAQQAGAGEASKGRLGQGWSRHGSAPRRNPVCSGGADLDYVADVGNPHCHGVGAVAPKALHRIRV